MIVRQQDLPGTLAHIASTLGDAGINIGTSQLHRTRQGGEAFTVMDVDDPVPEEVIDRILEFPAIRSVRFIPADGLHRNPGEVSSDIDPELALREFQKLDFATAAQLLSFCEENGVSLSYAAEARERALLASRGVAGSAIVSYLQRALDVMRASATAPVEAPRSSMGGLIGGEAQKLAQHSASGQGLCGELLEKAITYAMATLETNASMGLIVASPTAGSAGIVPGLLLAFQEVYHFSDKEIQQVLFNAGAVGYLAMRNATVAGAVGGCQAEVGVASAMAASAAVELMGGTPKQCLDAASTVLMNMLGLVCDPVGGLVEYPCQNRNAAGVANALIAAEMSLAGISQLIPFDEMLEAMYKVGKRLPVELRETALSGCATTPSACEACHIHA